jgi:hypothetical protein
MLCQPRNLSDSAALGCNHDGNGSLMTVRLSQIAIRLRRLSAGWRSEADAARER